MDRRHFLSRAGAGSALILGGTPAFALSNPARAPYAAPDIRTLEPDVELALHAFPSQQALRPGTATQTMTFRGEVLKGEAHNLEPLNNCFMGPTIRVRRGQRVRIHFYNELSKPTIIHWHGMHVPEEADGHPRLVIEPGERYQYDFVVDNRAGTYWYHTHPHGRVADEVMHGLCGAFIISDDEEDALPLPRGTFDLPVVLQDRGFDEDNQFALGDFGLADCMLVNGAEDQIFSAASRPYRLRMMNLSNDRSFKMGWGNGTPLTVIGTDGGLLEHPQERPYVMIGPSQRIDLWVDFSGMPVGTELEMRSLPFLKGPIAAFSSRLWFADYEGEEFQGLIKKAQAGEPMPDWDGFTLLKMRIDREEHVDLPLPDRLSFIPRIPPETAVNLNNPKRFLFKVDETEDSITFGINGREFEMNAVAPDEIVKLDTTEVWELNSAGFHVAHIHQVQFQILERSLMDSSPETLANWETVKDGFVDEGWHDTVMMIPGVSTRVIMRFEDFTGLFLYHCHNLHHEDAGMMRNFRIIA